MPRIVPRFKSTNQAHLESHAEEFGHETHCSVDERRVREQVDWLSVIQLAAVMESQCLCSDSIPKTVSRTMYHKKDSVG
jgi:hypothetical protein